MYGRVLGAGAVLLCLAGSGAAAGQVGDGAGAKPSGSGALQARVALKNANGGQIGAAILTQERDGIRIAVDINSSLQAGAKGFHIHERGVCTPPEFDSAGGHFDPTAKAHGWRHPRGPHAGDLPNLEAESAYGLVDMSFTNKLVTLLPGKPNSLLDADGSSLVIHATNDDGQSQPEGAAGPRIACGVIEAK